MTAVHHLFDDSNLLVELLVGVGVVGVDNAGRVLQITLGVKTEQDLQILVMVVGQGCVRAC